jgi:hypothetical protein
VVRAPEVKELRSVKSTTRNLPPMGSMYRDLDSVSDRSRSFLVPGYDIMVVSSIDGHPIVILYMNVCGS